eukprot:GHVR01119636.1.p1 GENE.GHVR01119636.1~~GHVR01119636.1.p1  ORF type:complete len:113 (-),score=1.95 GHVR01119636.1:322-660(-)
MAHLELIFFLLFFLLQSIHIISFIVILSSFFSDLFVYSSLPLRQCVCNHRFVSGFLMKLMPVKPSLFLLILLIDNNFHNNAFEYNFDILSTHFDLFYLNFYSNKPSFSIYQH